MGYWHQRADKRHGNPPQSSHAGAIIGQRQSWKTPGELGVSKSMECDIFPSVLWHCWLGDRKDIQPVKNWMLVCWLRWFDWSFARLIAPVVQLSPLTTSIILCFNKHRLTQVHLENGHYNTERERQSSECVNFICGILLLDCSQVTMDDPFLCLDLCYISALLQEGFGFNSASRLLVHRTFVQ